MLEWDSKFFGFPVAKISNLSELDTLRQQGVRLVYWSSPNMANQTMITAAGGSLVDKKITYQMDLSTITILPNQPQTSPVVVEYLDQTASADLIDLSTQAGLYSRFRVDQRMDQQKFHELYTQWIQKSCTHELAKAVLVIREQNHCVAVVTVGEKNGFGDIGLVAVDASQRGKGYGIALIRAAQAWFIQHGYVTSQVVTQQDNIAACRLYEKCGYKPASLEYYYHFWL